MPEERRKDYINIPVLCQKWDDFMTHTQEWREVQEQNFQETNKRLVELKEMLLKLPCPIREEKTKSITGQLTAIWLFITAMVLAIVGDWIRR